MKKLVSLLLSAVMLISASASVFAEGDEMKEALTKVKSKIDIASDLTKFESSVQDYGEKRYNFWWSTEDSYEQINVSADIYGNIKNYDYYNEDMYDYNKTSNVSKDDYFKVADAFIRKAAPDLFEFDNNKLSFIESGNISYNSCTFTYYRFKDDVKVPSNSASVTVRDTEKGLIVSDAYIDWEYTTEFIEDYDKVIENPKEKYLEVYPIELAYVNDYKLDKETGDYTKIPKLVYMFKGGYSGYISAIDGTKAEIEYDYADSTFKEAGSSMGSEEEYAGDLTPEEEAVIDELEDVKSAQEIIDSINKMKVFGTLPASDKFRTEIFKDEGVYKMNLRTITKDEKYYAITVDAKTGELYSLYSDRYSNTYEDMKKFTDAQYETASKTADDFMNKYYKDYLSSCAEPVETKEFNLNKVYQRTIDGILYDEDYFSVTCDPKTKNIVSFFKSWTADVSSFPKAENIISLDEATDKILNQAPIILQYIKLKDMFELCFTSSYAPIVDAKTGEFLYDYSNDDEIVFDDIENHWVEKTVYFLAERGLVDCNRAYRPDEKITQAELLKLLGKATNQIDCGSDEDALYDRLFREKYLTKDEKNPNAEVKREDAFDYLIRFMKLSKIASHNEIFKSNFLDDSVVSENRMGAVAILRAYGIVQGYGDSVRPSDSMTRAEAAALIYSYLCADK